MVDDIVEAVVEETSSTGSDIQSETPESGTEPTRRVSKTLVYSDTQQLRLELSATTVALANTQLNTLLERVQRLQAKADELAVEYRKNFDTISAKVAALSAQHDDLRDSAVAKTEKFQATVTEVLEACGESASDENWSIEFSDGFSLKRIVLYEEEVK